MEERTKLKIMLSGIGTLFILSLITLITTSVVIYNNQVHESNPAICPITGCEEVAQIQCPIKICNADGVCTHFYQMCYDIVFNVSLSLNGQNYNHTFEEILQYPICGTAAVDCYYDDRNPNNIILYPSDPTLRIILLAVFLIVTVASGGAFLALGFKYRSLDNNNLPTYN